MTSNQNSNRFGLRKVRNLVGVIAIAAAALTLSGCKDESKDANNPPTQTQTQPPQHLVTTVKLMPPESGENQRTYKKTPDGTLVEMDVDYRDGRIENYFFRPDGTVNSKKEFYPYTGVLKSTTEYAADGKAILSETQNRGNGTLEFVRKPLTDGTFEVTRYRIDGKRLQSVVHTQADGTFVDGTFYQADGKTLWAKAKANGASETEVQFYNAAGNVEKIRVSKANQNGYSSNVEFTISVLRADSTVAYKQTWGGYQSSYYSSVSLKTVEEYAADGKTVTRRLTFNYSGNNVSEAVVFENGVKKTVRTYRWDGTLETEQTFDATGKVTASASHTSKDNLHETVAPELIADQGGSDPLAFRPGDFQ